MAPQLLLSLLVLSSLPLGVIPFTTIPYAPHCNSVIPEPPRPSHGYGLGGCPSYHGYFCGGEEFLGGDYGVSSNFPFHHQRRISFQLDGDCNHAPTDTPGTFGLMKNLRFQQPHSDYHYDLSLSLHGYLSEISGETCLVGSGQGYPVNDHRVIRVVEAVVHLRYPKTSSASHAVVVGAVRSLDEEHHPSHFKSISLWLFHTRHYNYTLMSEAENLSVQLPDIAMESLAFNSGLEACSCLQGFESYRVKIDRDITLGALNGSLFTMMGFKCSPEGRLHSYLVFSDSHPSETWISEGLWDASRSRFSLVGCPTRETAVIPGDCSIGISLWFPATLTINRSNTIMGEIRSRHPDGHPDYIPPARLGAKSLQGRSSRQRYEFTRIEDVKRSCERPKSKSEKELYYSVNWLSRSKEFYFEVTNAGGVTVGRGYAEAFSIVRKKYWFAEHCFVSYNLRNLASDPSSVWDISAEGIYDFGTLCMVGCRSLPSADLDCEIQINIELPSKYLEAGSGIIRSGRKTSDPLYFETLQIRSFSSSLIEYTLVNDMDRNFLKMEEQIVYAICSTLACIFLALQISHAKRHPYAAPSISILMVVVSIASVIVPKLHALIGCTRSYGGKLVDRWRTGIMQTVHMSLLIVMLALQCYLLRVIHVARSIAIKEKCRRDYERRALIVCLPVYLVGFAMMRRYTEQTTSDDGMMRFEPPGSNFCTYLLSLAWFSAYAFDAFLLPQVVLNFFGDSKCKPLCCAFYVGTTVVVAAPRLLNFYLTLDYYNDPWDILTPFGQLVLAVIVYLQQRSGDTS